MGLDHLQLLLESATIWNVIMLNCYLMVLDHLQLLLGYVIMLKCYYMGLDHPQLLLGSAAMCNLIIFKCY